MQCYLSLTKIIQSTNSESQTSVLGSIVLCIILKRISYVMFTMQRHSHLHNWDNRPMMTIPTANTHRAFYVPGAFLALYIYVIFRKLNEVGQASYLSQQMKTVSPREVEKLAQDHTAHVSEPGFKPKQYAPESVL